MDVESIYGADDISAEVRDVHVTEINVLAAGGRNRAELHRLVALVLGPLVKVCFWGSGRCWKSVRVTCKSSQT